MSQSPLKVAVIGCGGRGRGHMNILKGFDDVALAAVCDPVPEALQAAADAFDVPGRYRDVEELLDSESLDAVIVATPAQLNAPTALPCLRNGIPTLLEKPPGMALSETQALVEAAEATGAKAMVGWNRRFHPIIVNALAMIRERGPVLQIVGEFHKSMAQFMRSGRFPEIIMDNMLLETPIHAIDTTRAVADADVAEVYSVVRRANSPYKDVHAALVAFENGCVAQLTANYTTDARLERYEIHGCEISAYLEGVSHGVVVCDGQRHELTGAGTAGTEEQDRYFLDCVKEDRSISLPAADLKEAVKTMALVQAILSGLRE